MALHLAAGDVSFHHTLAFHRSGGNRTGARRIGIGVSYIPTRVRHVGTTRLSATLVRGTDAYGHFDHEPAPLADEDAAALRAHAELGRPLLEGVREHPGDGNGALSAAP